MASESAGGATESKYTDGSPRSEEEGDDDRKQPSTAAEDYGEEEGVEAVNTPALATAGIFDPRAAAAGGGGGPRPPPVPPAVVVVGAAPEGAGIAAAAGSRRRVSAHVPARASSSPPAQLQQQQQQQQQLAPPFGAAATAATPALLSQRYSSASAVLPAPTTRTTRSTSVPRQQPPPSSLPSSPSAPIVRELRASKFIVATGAAPLWPSAAIPGLDAAAAYVLTSETLWDNAFLPRRLVVIGAGPQGCEVAQAYRRLGADVTLVGPRLLPREDAAVRDVLRRVLYRERVAVVAGVVDRITVVSDVQQQLAATALPLQQLGGAALSPHAEPLQQPASTLPPPAAAPRAPPSSRGSIGGGSVGGGGGIPWQRRRGDSISAADGVPTPEVLAMAAAAAAAAAAGRQTPTGPSELAGSGGAAAVPLLLRESRGPSPGAASGPPSARTLSPMGADAVGGAHGGAHGPPPLPAASSAPLHHHSAAPYSRGASVSSPVPLASGSGGPTAAAAAPVWVHVGERAYPADLVVLAVGRAAGPALAGLTLDKAGVLPPHHRSRPASPPAGSSGGGGSSSVWATADGLPVHPATLQCTSAAHVFAAGDCAWVASAGGSGSGSGVTASEQLGNVRGGGEAGRSAA